MDIEFETERASPFFSWFQLEEIVEPRPLGDGGCWRCFRPNGPAFRPLVEVDVEVSRDGAVRSSCIGLARAFIDHQRNAAFARDIAKSFLAWALRPPSPQAAALIDNISALAGLPVIMRGPGPKPPAPDLSGGYDVFLGARAGADLTTDGLKLRNFNEAFPSEDVHRFAEELRRSGSTAARAGAGPASSGWLLIDATAR